MAIHNARRILLCLRYGIGDVVMEMPAVEALRRAAPQAHITALGTRPAIELLEGDPRVDAHACVQDFGFDHWGDSGREAAREKFRQWYRNGRFELVLDPSHAVAGIGDILWESPQPTLRDARASWQAEALRAGADGPAAVRYAVETGWGLRVGTDPPRLHVDRVARERADDLLVCFGFQHKRVAAVSPAASSPLKRWPLQNFVTAARHLVERGWAVIVPAGPEEQPLAQAICDGVPPGQAACVGALHLQEVTSLLSRCGLLLCNDTGLMHLAAAVGTTPIAIFGPTDPLLYAPPGARAVGGQDMGCLCRQSAAFGPPACVAAGRCMRQQGTCIEQVDVAQVLAALDQEIGDSPKETSAWMPRRPIGC